ncbi:hypothetical protein BOSE62_150410 [Bosea sp. 62]|nr:hypothetical protein BOSE7B_150489 [Bosea sp. 7B]VXB82055.1 hypothetical protein BOSE62_150410 [Bosea sp. 62]VXC44306.1 hypothetical protein BOSE127_190117 [Bosea sp. 127]
MEIALATSGIGYARHSVNLPLPRQQVLKGLHCRGCRLGPLRALHRPPLARRKQGR